MNVTSYRKPEDWINAVLKESYDDYGHMAYYPHTIYGNESQWGMVMPMGLLYASNLDRSNEETITAHMLQHYPRQCQVICPVFKPSGLWVMLKRKDGKPTQAALHIYDILYALEDSYPVFDSDDYERREYDQQIESIESIVRSYLDDNAPTNYAQTIFSWLWDNDQESIISEDNAYCDDTGVFSAAIALGYIDISDPDDLVLPSYILRSIDQNIVRSFNKTR